jgi:flagellar biosynthesis/type III secretory pathway protein FliH
MTSLTNLKREVEVLHKALNLKAEVPEWKKQSDLIQQLLKENEELSEEKQEANMEVLEWYRASLNHLTFFCFYLSNCNKL